MAVATLCTCLSNGFKTQVLTFSSLPEVLPTEHSKLVDHVYNYYHCVHFTSPPPCFSFVSLLEHAEEELRCRTVYVFFEQCVSAELRRQILHSFHLMGFQIVPPSDPTVSLVGSQYYFMSYELEDSDDDED